MNKISKFSTRQLTGIAILGALSSILFLFEIPIVLFYKLDFSNLPVLLGTFAYGPLSGTFILLIKNLTGLLHTTSGGVGQLADFLNGIVFVLIAGFYYKKDRTRKGALIGMLISVIVSTIISVFINMYLLIPFYIPKEGAAVITRMAQGQFPFIDSFFKVMLFITAPFNLLKGVVISFITFLLYKKLSPILHGRK